MKYSKQYELVLDFVKSVKTHPTAENIYINLRKYNPNISLGTVYRNLEKLVKNDEIKRLNLANTKDRFDSNTKNHYHAICTKCGEVVDIFIDYLSNIDIEVQNSIECQVVSHDIIFNTICPKCK
ncbi:MAG: transcriptional repressor [Clostridia bacterium]